MGTRKDIGDMGEHEQMGDTSRQGDMEGQGQGYGGGTWRDEGCGEIRGGTGADGDMEEHGILGHMSRGGDGGTQRVWGT